MRLFLNKTIHYIVALACICLQSVYALPADNEQKMHITADSTVFNYQSGFNTYEGNVKIDQGETHLTADRVTTQANAQHKIEEGIAYGMKQPAHYWTIPKIGDLLFHARANIIKFYPQKSLVILEGDVFVNQGNNSFQGPTVTYNMRDQIVSTPSTTKGRATIIIEPKQITS